MAVSRRLFRHLWRFVAPYDSDRPALQYVRVEDGLAIATDGRRLTFASGIDLDNGFYTKDAEPETDDEGLKYPDWRKVVPSIDEPGRILVDVDFESVKVEYGVCDGCRDLVAVLPGPSGEVHVWMPFIDDILCWCGTPQIYVGGEKSPVLFVYPELTSVVMPRRK